MKKNTVVRSVLIVSLVSVLCLILCFGPTFALLIDKVVNDNNVIKSGTLKIDLQIMDGEGNYRSVRQNDIPIFNYDKWEAGYTQVVNARVVNKGDLSLFYEFEVVATGILEALMINTPLLSDVIDVYYASSEIVMSTRSELEDAIATERLTHVGTLTQLLLGGILIKDYLLPVGADPANGESEHYSTLVLIMKEEVGLEYQGLTVGDETFKFNLTAKQYSYENDSFDNKYDLSKPKGYIFDGGKTYNVDTSVILNENSESTDVITAIGEGTVVNITGGYYDVASKDCAVWAKDGATVNIYGGVFFCDGLGTDAIPSNHQDLIYAGENGGKINIYGGYFVSRDKGAWLLNEKDGDGQITVYGGTFANWNPGDNDSEGEHTNFLAIDTTVLELTRNDTKYYSVSSAAASLSDNKDGDLVLPGGILHVMNTPLTHNTNRTGEFTVDGNNTVVNMEVYENTDFFPDDEELTGGYKFPARCILFSTSDSSKVTVNDLTITGVAHMVLVGDYRDVNAKTIETELNNVNIVNLQTLRYSKWCAGMIICGKSTITNCSVYGTTRYRYPDDPYGMDDPTTVYDVVVSNSSDVHIDGGKYGSFYIDNHGRIEIVGAEIDIITSEAFIREPSEINYVRLGQGAHVKRIVANFSRSTFFVEDDAVVEVLDLTKMKKAYVSQIHISDTATVGKIIDGTNEFSTYEEWVAWKTA